MDDPTLRDALLLESKMFSFIRRSQFSTGPSRSMSDLADYARPKRLPWVNFNICPHCLVHGRTCLFESPKEWGPIISRSDGVEFHLIMGDRPIAYPTEKVAGKAEMMSVAFWYVHETNGSSTEAVVVILRRPHRRGVSLLRDLEKVADKLADKLCKEKQLSRLYDFDGRQIHRVS